MCVLGEGGGYLQEPKREKRLHCHKAGRRQAGPLHRHCGTHCHAYADVPTGVQGRHGGAEGGGQVNGEKGTDSHANTTTRETGKAGLLLVRQPMTASAARTHAPHAGWEREGRPRGLRVEPAPPPQSHVECQHAVEHELRVGQDAPCFHDVEDVHQHQHGRKGGAEGACVRSEQGGGGSR